MPPVRGLDSPSRAEGDFSINAWNWRDGYSFDNLQGLFGIAIRYGKDHYVCGCNNDNLAQFLLGWRRADVPIPRT